MKKIIINGAKALKGEISVSGSKNAALPIIFACILTNGVSEIENLPSIGDVFVALNLLRSFGAKIEQFGTTTFIDTRGLSYVTPDPILTSKIRASTYLLGSCLSRFGRCHLQAFGGCNFSHRPIDMHIDACLTLGGEMDGDIIRTAGLHGGEIHFAKASVGATVNAILLASSADGETQIHGCAVEPHIDSLIEFLISCGAKISRQGRDVSVVGSSLHGGRIRVAGDAIEAGSYLTLGLMTGGNILVKNAPIESMSAFFDATSRIGAELTVKEGVVKACLTSSEYLSITTSPYPGFPTDLQPILAPLMALCSGGEITDTVWKDRFGYLSSLSAFGIRSSVVGNKALIYPSKIHSGSATSPDLRGGMACLMTALATRGQSEILSLDTILRGYEDLEKKLSTLGADIKIEDL